MFSRSCASIEGAIENAGCLPQARPNGFDLISWPV